MKKRFCCCFVSIWILLFLSVSVWKMKRGKTSNNKAHIYVLLFQSNPKVHFVLGLHCYAFVPSEIQSTVNSMENNNKRKKWQKWRRNWTKYRRINEIKGNILLWKMKMLFVCCWQCMNWKIAIVTRKQQTVNSDFHIVRMYFSASSAPTLHHESNKNQSKWHIQTESKRKWIRI